MLGRLRMCIEEATVEFEKLCLKVFKGRPFYLADKRYDYRVRGRS